MINSLLIPNSYPTRCVVEGPLAEIQAHVPQTEIGEGYATTGETIFWHHGAWHTTGGGSSSPATATTAGVVKTGPGNSTLTDGTLQTPTSLGRPLRLATFGSSIATPNTNVPEWDIENLIIPIPGSGTLGRIMSCLGAPSLYLGRHYLVGVGGIGGQTTALMIARSYATPSTTRKSMMDIISKRPDVILLMGGEINDIAGTASGANVSAVAAASFATAYELIQMATSRGIHVIDMGVYGYSGGGLGDIPTVQAVAVAINNLCAAIKDPHYHYWSPEGIMGTAGGYYPQNTLDGIHPSALGAYLAGKEQKRIIDALFAPSLSYSSILYDGSVDWGTPTSGVPGYCTFTPSMTVSTKTSDPNGMIINGTVASVGQGFAFKVNTLATAFSGLSAGDHILADVAIDLFDGSGNPIDANIDAYFVLLDTTNANTLLLGSTASGGNGKYVATISANMPQNAPIGSTSYFYIQVKPFNTGSVVINLRPVLFYKP